MSFMAQGVSLVFIHFPGLSTVIIQVVRLLRESFDLEPGIDATGIFATQRSKKKLIGVVTMFIGCFVSLVLLCMFSDDTMWASNEIMEHADITVTTVGMIMTAFLLAKPTNVARDEAIVDGTVTEMQRESDER
eukprot:CAMPEP_0170177408 /NCGR_PEP_ID=MMETSP0040_2-20121228/10063_1 /TAXON_ID=641309 /ORGANISM="Lotharella oceanica, Strain CCMP622" /LENGTH=132 /DNA_ID=CAMNT_0010420035 /DNA_START=347 /DNA_END=745 /DNA_ORIENTATION=-